MGGDDPMASRKHGAHANDLFVLPRHAFVRLRLMRLLPIGSRWNSFGSEN